MAIAVSQGDLFDVIVPILRGATWQAVPGTIKYEGNGSHVLDGWSFRWVG